MYTAFGISGLVVIILAYVALSIYVRTRQRALGIEPSKELKRAIRIGVVWVNMPILPILLAPLSIQKFFWPNAHAVISGCLLLVGFVAAWAWWSVTVSLWRQWAALRGIEPDALQWEGESSSLLWPKGHFFERTEYERLRRRRGT